MAESTTNVSSCCKAELKVVSADEGTSHYECVKCGKECDSVISVAEQTMWEGRFEQLWIMQALPLDLGNDNSQYRFIERFIAQELAAARANERERVMALAENGLRLRDELTKEKVMMVVEREVERMAIRKDYVSLKDVEDLINLIRAKV